MVLVKNWQLFILGEIGQENVFHDTLERKKMLSLTIITRN